MAGQADRICKLSEERLVRVRQLAELADGVLLPEAAPAPEPPAERQRRGDTPGSIRFPFGGHR